MEKVKQDHSDSTPVKEKFQCKIEGCKQSFTTELHCNVHTKKHDLSLNLEMPLKGQGVIFADQTPTPTRLIGKCEEVGLFEDLQKVNPFDETFRRAVESGTGSSTPSLAGDQTPLDGTQTVRCCRAAEGETLHTPHIFPSGIDRSTLETASSENAVIKQRAKIRATGVSLRSKQTVYQQVKDAPSTTSTTIKSNNESKSSKKTLATKRKAPAVVDILPKPSAQPTTYAGESIPLIIIPSGSSDTKQPAEGTVLVKEKLKEHLAKVRESTTAQGPKESSAGKKRSKMHVEAKSDPPSKPTKSIDLTKPTDEQANLKHERWKAAAKRYRERVKKSQDRQLQRSIELEEENLRLRTELAELKHTHRNCSVTRSASSVKIAVVQGADGTLTQGITTSSTVTQQEVNAALLNSIEQQQQLQQSAPLSVLQQRYITSHIIDGNTFNRVPIIIVMGSTATAGVASTAVSGSTGRALEEGTG
ncbi:cyclic AMP-dependent transcription factor ATF-2 [Anopheles maculipalpis]|uniref:cyclic AMP-dependent transcription factor ATF-2 n=1 Tax=Anopheles maculipalpis TaxID=1496333 RepID=UPI002158AF81|nr:cyclic AMP-dependent transcription factor ATF-2 [Anopheles maculipalpis]